jgi:glycosyltransferase involved in cell wall biosynthesis
VQSLHFVDAFASIRSGKWPTVYYVTGPPVPQHVPRIPPDRKMLRDAIVHADAVLVPSRHVAEVVQQYYGVEPRIVPVPIHARPFAAQPSVRKSPRPLVLSVSAVDDVRKGARPLVQAFARLRERIPEVRLRVCAEASGDNRAALLGSVPEAVREAIEFVGPGRLQDLPSQYQEAWVTVLPSKWEAYGLVLLESWAAGTPVVATDDSALPELVDDERVGLLFEPGDGGPEITNIEGLTDALIRGLELGSRPETSALCRTKAASYSWERLGPAYDRVYAEVLSRGGSRATRSSEPAPSR